MQLQIFKYQEDEDHFDNMTTIEIEGEAWFVASEVCKLLDIKIQVMLYQGLTMTKKGYRLYRHPLAIKKNLLFQKVGFTHWFSRAKSLLQRNSVNGLLKR